MKKSINLAVILTVLFFFSSCKDKDLDISYERYAPEDYAVLSQSLNIPNDEVLDYTFVFPKYYNSRSLSMDSDLATLGRVLFYDKTLSEDRTISCASCHKQELAFADNVAFSQGVADRKTKRNSLALGSVFNFSEYYGDAAQGRIPFFWDNRATTVQQQSRQTLANADEMNMPMHKVKARVQEHDYYNVLFKEAYGDSEITEDRILDAISEFVNSMSAYQSKYDEALDKHYATNYNTYNIEGVKLAGLTDQENMGKDIYLSSCGNCHGRINGFPAKIAANNGLDMSYEDNGIGAIMGANQNGVFKVPTLRNIELTAPYMHDGRFQTLEQVVNHYSNGIQNHPNLDYELRAGNQPRKFNFSSEEKTALIAFLKTFTDKKMQTDVRYSDPFK